ncbi:flavodoxin family protein [Brevibacillus fluminis]|uniref:Flavodoxin family protein n=1 Tax=Brevibacillus fluminis TaxID=511487 RepID=A0A3M8DN18_9BACL|nr:NAD(P)H-dependent oxidoreductase [Brevibacillus fluminis]RNB89468.1 flavodoxin family protein [Brevibacillus fluminis]
MKTIVILCHPTLERSRVNRTWANRLKQESRITLHNLYQEYPDKLIDSKREQALLSAHERIVFQFPLYWYNIPSFLKQWQEEVLEYGWVTGEGGRMLQGKEIVLAISVGAHEKAYQAGGFNSFSISELTRPMQAIANLIGMKFLPPFLLFGAAQASEEEIGKSAEAYVQHILDENLDPRLALRRAMQKQAN